MKQLFSRLHWIFLGLLLRTIMTSGQEGISSDYDGYSESTRAIDGSKNTWSHTGNDLDTSWWMVDLLKVYCVNRVTITNSKGDGHDSSLSGAVISIGDSKDVYNNVCSTVSSIPAGETVSFNCNGMQGRYVVIFINGHKYLLLADVGVYGHLAEIQPKWGKSTQSSNSNSFFAIDWLSSTWAYTSNESNPWWKVDLLREYRVNTVSFAAVNWHTRGVIRVGNSPDLYFNPICAEISDIGNYETITVSCGGLEGRYVIVQINGLMYLMLNAFGIWGYFTGNLAPSGTAAQSTTFKDAFAPRAIGQELQSTCSSTTYETDPWWMVDLGDVHRVHKVTVKNRNDIYAQRLQGAEIRIGNSAENWKSNTLCALIADIPAGETYNFSCNEMEGQYVVIVLPGLNKCLSLCMVKVYGVLSVNLAVNGIATQSSSYSDWVAKNAIEQGLQQLSIGCSSTFVEDNPWWRLDLGNVYEVHRVVFSLRYSGDDLYKAEIRIGNSLWNNGNSNPRCAVIMSSPVDMLYNISCNMEGRYVNLMVPGVMKMLTLCDVMVTGTPAKQTIGLNGKRSFVRIWFKSGAELTKSATGSLMNQLGTALADMGLSVTSRWSQTPEKLEVKTTNRTRCSNWV
ncbi:hypothetical protein DNTS_022860 [Danionella cerebrum]|uniref:Fucolectin tachylectin-4 pentraxin-1 domain-containing protein n=1 Tax=Danionella cerebrum TaxID=2873325 RepID=A0A553QU94_9TELE|nr:hypothetical protein DNTS_022860 [Danionella translucida]